MSKTNYEILEVITFKSGRNNNRKKKNKTNNRFQAGRLINSAGNWQPLSWKFSQMEKENWQVLTEMMVTNGHYLNVEEKWRVCRR